MIKDIKNVFLDVSKMYVNFGHWIGSKICISISSFILGIILALPFLVLIIILAMIDDIAWKSLLTNYLATNTLGLETLAMLSENILMVILEVLVLLLGLAGFIVGSSYGYVLYYNLNLNYINGNKLAVKDNLYFDIKKIYLNFKILNWYGLIFLIPIALFILISFGLILGFGGIDAIYASIDTDSYRYFTALVGIAFFSNALLLIYLAFRISFAQVLMIDKDLDFQENDALFYIKKSFSITSGIKIFKFLVIFLIFVIVTGPFEYISGYLENKGELIVFLYAMFVFIVFGGLKEMIITSGYKRIMLDKENLEESEINQTKTEIL